MSNHYDPQQHLDIWRDKHTLPYPRPLLIEQGFSNPQSLSWTANSVQAIEFQEQIVNGITGRVYERLLSRTGTPFLGSGRIHTLTDDAKASLSDPQANDNLNSGPGPRDTVVLLPQSSKKVERKDFNTNIIGEPYQSNRQDTLADEINEYLRSMHLHELSREEAEQLAGHVEISQRVLLTGAEQASSPDEYDTTGFNSRPRLPQKRFFTKKSSFGSTMVDPVSVMGLATSMLQCVAASARVAYQIRSFIFDFYQIELLRLSDSITSYSSLLHSVIDVVRDSIHIRELQDLCGRVIRQSEGLLKEVQDVIGWYATSAERGFVGNIVASVRWRSKRTVIFEMMDRIESLKATLSVMLQIHQVRMTGQNLQATERELAAAQYNLYGMRKFSEKVPHRQRVLMDKETKIR